MDAYIDTVRAARWEAVPEEGVEEMRWMCNSTATADTRQDGRRR
jgi:hypothetical protein